MDKTEWIRTKLLDFFDKSAVGANLADLATAYEQVTEIARTSRKNSRAASLATVATPSIEKGFKALSRFGHREQAEELQRKIDAARILPVVNI